MDELDKQLKAKAHDALIRMAGDVDGAANLLYRWVQSGECHGVVERAVTDYLHSIVSEEALVLDA